MCPAMPCFEFMHGESVGVAVTPTVAIAYGAVAVFLFALSRSTEGAAEPIPAGHAAIAAAE